MKKQLLVFILAGLLYQAAAAQTSREKVEKAIQDPKAAENAAKADTRLIDLKNPVDSTILAPAPATKKEKRCFLKRKKKSAKTSS